MHPTHVTPLYLSFLISLVGVTIAVRCRVPCSGSSVIVVIPRGHCDPHCWNYLRQAWARLVIGT